MVEKEANPTLSRRRRDLARSLRNNATDAKRELWRHLRRRLPLYKTHFRRQFPIGPYVADFVCLNPRIVIEVDGSQHALEPDAKRDAARTAFLEQQNFRVLRFWNHEIFREIESVLDTIFATMFPATPTPYPSPQGGGEAASVAPDWTQTQLMPRNESESVEGGGSKNAKQERTRRRRNPLPLVGRGKGWGSPR